MPFRLILATLLVCTLAMPVGAQCVGASFYDRLTTTDRATLDSIAAETPFGRGLIWTATRGDATLTVVGTMHITDPRHATLLARIAPAIARADLLLVEATKDDEAAMRAAMAADPGIMFITDGPTLIDRLDGETWNTLKNAAESRQIPGFMTAKMQPWFLMVTLAIPTCAMAGIQAGGRGLDQMIMQSADDNAVPVQALESWRTMFDLLTGTSFDEQVAMLKTAIMPEDLLSEMYVALQDDYFAGRVAEIWEMSRLSMNYIPGMDLAEAEAGFAQTEQLLLINRNAAWVPVIEAAAAGKKSVVVAFGAAHLPGENGVLRLLEQQGWAIAPLD